MNINFNQKHWNLILMNTSKNLINSVASCNNQAYLFLKLLLLSLLSSLLLWLLLLLLLLRKMKELVLRFSLPHLQLHRRICLKLQSHFRSCRDSNSHLKLNFRLKSDFVPYLQNQGGNSQNFLPKFVRFFVTLRCFYGVVVHRK